MSLNRNQRRLKNKTRPGRPDPFAPQLAEARQLCAVAQWYEAEQVYRAILQRDPQHAEAWHQLGLLALQAEQRQIALDAFGRAARHAPDDYRHHYRQGVALKDVGRPEEAEAVLRTALRLHRKDPAVLSDLGLVLSYQGRFDEAIEAYRKAIRLKRNFIIAHYNLAMSKKFSPQDPDLEMLERLHRQRADFDAAGVSALCFALGKAYDDCGRYDEAFVVLEEGNRLVRQGRRFDITEFENILARVERSLTPECIMRFTGAGSDSDTPIFVLGMPRSGTTLVEHILSRHSRVTTVGECVYVRDALARFPGFMGVSEVEAVQLGCELLAQADADADALRQLGDSYVKYAHAGAQCGMHIIDKTPLNFLQLGMLALMLPQARIIHCKRNPLDTGVSIFQQYFSSGHDYAYTLTEIGQFYNLYRRYMQLWGELFPGRIIDVQYEDLVSNTESEVRRLLTACGLAWEPECLERGGGRGSFNTASKLQVHQPVYTSSVARWRRYEKHLGPLVEVLGLG